MPCGIIVTDEGRLHVDLAGREHDRVDALLKGNQQKTQLNAALLHEPVLAVTATAAARERKVLRFAPGHARTAHDGGSDLHHDREGG